MEHLQSPTGRRGPEGPRLAVPAEAGRYLYRPGNKAGAAPQALRLAMSTLTPTPMVEETATFLT